MVTLYHELELILLKLTIASNEKRQQVLIAICNSMTILPQWAPITTTSYSRVPRSLVATMQVGVQLRTVR
jgi:hypothetical protein